MTPTHELVKACIPTREDKRRVMRQLGLNSESTLYKWTEDPEGSGRPNPIDYMDVILDHARLYHPDAALAVVQHFDAANHRALGRQAAGVSTAQLLAQLQPGSEKEAHEAVAAFSAALLQVVVRGTCDLRALLQEVEEGERQLKAAAVMLRAAVEAQAVAAGAR